MCASCRVLLAWALPLVVSGAISDQALVGKIRDRVKESRIRPGERKMDRIGWAPTLTEALRLAKENGRPVFFLMHYGSVATGRCDGDAFALRATSLSSDSIISTLNEYYVPVYRAWDDFGPQGVSTAEERQEYQRIIKEAMDKKIPVADVRVFILTPDGHPMPANLGMSDPYRVLRGLLQVVMELKTVQGKVLVPPKVQSVPPEMPPQSLVMHTVARGTRTGNWREFPAENWTVFQKEQWSKLLPPGGTAQVGTSWNVDPGTAGSILTTFYPATEEDSRKDRNRIQKIAWKARVVSVEDGVAVARIEAQMKARRSFYPGREPTDHLDVKVEGFLRFAADGSDVFSIGLVTSDAFYEDEEFLATLEDLKELPSIPVTAEGK